jgi:excinuclease UvrABC ATPase subunit
VAAQARPPPPSVGLHPRDVDRLVRLLGELRDLGNTILVVEHDRDVLSAADRVVELGPGGGSEGGTVVFEGTPKQLARAKTVTGRALRAARPLNRESRPAAGVLEVCGADRHNLRAVDVDIPTGVLVAVTGVAGSGKSSRTQVLVEQHPEVTLVDQSPVGISSRSTPASYVGALDLIRRRFAAESGEQPGLFSFNAAGACPVCGGRGTITIDLAYMAPVTRTCGTCDGRHYGPQALAHTWNGRSIAEVLELTIDDALHDLDDAAVAARLRPLGDVGIGHLTLGRALGTLSGGERQRLKFADRLDYHTAILVLDEPTIGLHRPTSRGCSRCSTGSLMPATPSSSSSTTSTSSATPTGSSTWAPRPDATEARSSSKAPRSNSAPAPAPTPPTSSATLRGPRTHDPRVEPHGNASKLAVTPPGQVAIVPA